MSPSNSGRTSMVRGATGVAAAMAVMNAATYAYNVVAVYLIGPDEYGVTAALMGLVNVANVMALGLQATGARRMTAESSTDLVEVAVMRLSVQAGVVLAAGCLALAPLIDRGLNLADLTTTSMLALTMLPLTIFGGQIGILQGQQKWAALATVYVTLGVTRLVAGAVAMWVSPTALASMVAVAGAAWLPVALGFVVLGHHRRTSDFSRRGLLSQEVAIVREILHNSHALLALFSLSIVDVLVAKAMFDDHLAGLYAAGAIITKAVMFLPQFVVVMAFPSMARPNRPRWLHLRAMAVVAALGGACVVAALLLPGAALALSGGHDFAGVGPYLPWFALLGTVLAMLQVVVYDAMARRVTGTVPVLWVGLAAAVTAGVHADVIPALVQRLIIVTLCTLAILITLGARQPARVAPRGATGQPALSADG